MTEQKKIVSRSEALSLGLKKYFTGNNCKNGHVSERYTIHRSCIGCLQEKASSENAKEWMRRHNKMRRQLPEYLETERNIRNGDSSKKRKLAYNKKPGMKEWRRQYEKARKASDPVFLMRRNVAGLISGRIKNKGYTKKSTAGTILGCGWIDFKSHIEKQFTKDMNWSNYGQWEIDHIIPISSAKTYYEVLKLNHFTNLRPLCAKANRAKSDKNLFLI